MSLTIDDVILFVLFTWVLPLSAFVVYFTTDAVPGKKWRRRMIRLRDLKPVSVILLVQKLAFISVVLFIGIVRFTGGFPGREWVAFALYTLLVLVAWAAFIDLRILQLPRERRIRNGKEKP